MKKTNREKYAEAANLVAAGTHSNGEAAKAVKMPASEFYRLRRDAAAKESTPLGDGAAIVTIHEAPRSKPGTRSSNGGTGNIMIIVVPPSRLREVMASL